MAGYSGTPLPQKLGIKGNSRVTVLGAPDDFGATLGLLPPGATVTDRFVGAQRADIILLFVRNQSDVVRRFSHAARHLEPAGGLWVVWPKKTSRLASDVTEDTIRAVAVAAGLVDNKVCAVDEIWSGLRCVIRLKDRPPPSQTKRG